MMMMVPAICQYTYWLCGDVLGCLNWCWLLLCEGIQSGAGVGCCYVKAYRVEPVLVVVMW